MVDNTSDDLKVIDVSNPSVPVFRSSFGVGPYPTAVVSSGSYVYVVDQFSGDLKVIDVSTPSAPSLAGSLVTGPYPIALAISGSYAYVADYTSDSLKVIDVSTPSTPTLVGSLKIGTEPMSITVSGNHVFVIDQGSDDLKIVDVRTPSAPILLGALGIGPKPFSIAVSGNHAYVVDKESNDLKVINIFCPASSIAISPSSGEFIEGPPGLWDDQGSDIYSLNSGNVGIGTTSPDNRLHVHRGSAGTVDANSNSIAIFEHSNSGYLNLLTPNTKQSGVLFGNPSDAEAGGVIYNATNTPDGLQFRTNGNSTKMVIDASGEVGIGTTSPNSQLSITPDAVGAKLTLWDGGNTSFHAGLGISPSQLNYHAAGTGDSHVFYAGGKNGDGTELLRIQGDGKVGIGTPMPATKLHLEDGALLAQGTTGGTPVAGAGTRLMWIPSKGAFRAGKVGDDQWDDNNIGTNSAVVGGHSNSATQPSSFVGGGIFNSSTGSWSFVGGGSFNGASGQNSFVGGGTGNVATGFGSFIGGGDGLHARSPNEAVFGAYNRDYSPNAPAGWDAEDRLFVIGNGTGSNNRGNAVTVLKNGNVGIGEDSPTTAKLVIDNGAGGIGLDLASSDSYAEMRVIRNSKHGSNNLYLGYGAGGNAKTYLYSGGVNPVLTVSEGKVGIGETSPNVRLHVKGDAPNDYVMALENTHVDGGGGLMIKVNETQANHQNDFILFADNTDIRGRIEGQTIGDIQADLGSFLRNLIDPDGALTNHENLSGALNPLDWVSFNGLAANGQNGQTNLDDINTANFTAVFDQYFDPNMSSEFFVETILLGVDVVCAAITAASAAASVADPEDIFVGFVELLAAVANLGVYVGFTLANTGVAFQTGSGDYAEWLVKADSTELCTRGDIVGVRAGEISKTWTEADHFMAISTAPAVAGMMPAPEDEHLYEMVAFMGQIPVKVRGVVNKGDYVLPSGDGDGLGIAVDPENMLPKDYHRVVGIAWDDSDGKEHFKMINTAVGINQNDLADIVDEMQALLNTMQLALKEVNPDFEVKLYQTDGEHPETEMVSTKLDYTVSPTHASNVSAYFTGKTYGSQEERIDAVRYALVELADVDLEANPLVTYILDNPDKSEAIIAYYSEILAALSKSAEILQQMGG